MADRKRIYDYSSAREVLLSGGYLIAAPGSTESAWLMPPPSETQKVMGFVRPVTIHKLKREDWLLHVDQPESIRAARKAAGWSSDMRIMVLPHRGRQSTKASCDPFVAFAKKLDHEANERREYARNLTRANGGGETDQCHDLYLAANVLSLVAAAARDAATQP